MAKLPTDGTYLSIRDDLYRLRVGPLTDDRSRLVRVLELENTATWECWNFEIPAEPWVAGHYDLYDWVSANVVVLSAAARITALGLDKPNLQAAMGLEYEESETLESPWFAEGQGILIVATEFRIWSLDATPSIRWCWSARTEPNYRQICAQPTIDPLTVNLTLRERRGDSIVHLRAQDGLQLAEERLWGTGRS